MKKLIFATLAAATVASSVAASGLDVFPLGYGGPSYNISSGVIPDKYDNELQHIKPGHHFNHGGGDAIVTYKHGKHSDFTFSHHGDYPHLRKKANTATRTDPYTYGKKPKLVFSHTDKAIYKGQEVRVGVFVEKGWHIDGIKNPGYTVIENQAFQVVENGTKVNGRWLETGYTYYFIK